MVRGTIHKRISTIPLIRGLYWWVTDSSTHKSEMESVDVTAGCDAKFQTGRRLKAMTSNSFKLFDWVKIRRLANLENIAYRCATKLTRSRH